MALPPVTIADPSMALSVWLAVLPVVMPLCAGAVLIVLRRAAHLHAGIALFTLAALVCIDATLLFKVAASGPMTMALGNWPPPFGIAFTADLLGALMALAAAIAALAACLHAGREIGSDRRRDGFYPLAMLLMAGVSGAFLTGDIFNLYVWFEVLLMASFGLMVSGSTPGQLDGGLKYTVLNLIGAALFLIAAGGLYAVFGTLNMADLARKAALAGTASMTLAALLSLAFAMKAAAFPVHFWLPASYHTPPSAISALLGGLMTKVGIYALLRVMVMILPREREALGSAIAAVAILTMLFGGLGALAERDMRRMLGFFVISGVGTMLAGVALGTAAGIGGAIFYAVHSVILVAALYLVAGQAGRAPAATGLALALFFSAGGLPPFSGFWPKLMLLNAATDAGAFWLAAAMLLSGLLVTMALTRLFLLRFWRPAPAVAGFSGAPRQSVAPLAALTLLIVLAGLFPESLINLSQRAARGLIDPTAYIGSVFAPESP